MQSTVFEACPCPTQRQPILPFLGCQESHSTQSSSSHQGCSVNDSPRPSKTPPNRLHHYLGQPTKPLLVIEEVQLLRRQFNELISNGSWIPTSTKPTNLYMYIIRFLSLYPLIFIFGFKTLNSLSGIFGFKILNSVATGESNNLAVKNPQKNPNLYHYPRCQISLSKLNQWFISLPLPNQVPILSPSHCNRSKSDVGFGVQIQGFVLKNLDFGVQILDFWVEIFDIWIQILDFWVQNLDFWVQNLDLSLSLSLSLSLVAEANATDFRSNENCHQCCQRTDLRRSSTVPVRGKPTTMVQ